MIYERYGMGKVIQFKNNDYVWLHVEKPFKRTLSTSITETNLEYKPIGPTLLVEWGDE